MRYDADTQKRLTRVSRDFLTALPNIKEEELISQLVEILIFHEHRYYVLNDPLISDAEYDQLYKKLEALEREYPDLVQADSPTQRVSSDLTEGFPSVPHLKPMLSLDNSYNAEDLTDFDKQIRKLTGKGPGEDIEYCVEPKFDGGTIVLVYEDNKLVRAATRGNGALGEEITNNARAIRSIPVYANFDTSGIYRAELRGEAIIRKSRFHKINATREEEGKALFANPRNAATGGLRVKDHKDVISRGLEAFIYQISVGEDEHNRDRTDDLGGHDNAIEFLGTLGFKVPVKERKLCKNIEEVIKFCQYWEEKREDYDYEIDGMVVKVNDFKLQEICGSTSHHPRWAIAFKFKAKQATSKLLQIEYQVGKTGAITPVAKIEPVPLAGVTVSSVSLHNEDFISSKDIRLGDIVLVERAGDVIPYIVKPMEELRTGDETIISFPTNCPSCDSLLVRPEGEAAWRCVNNVCPAQSLQKMIHHVSKDGMDIDGFGKSLVERFADLGWLQDISDIYRLDYAQMASLEGFGSKSAENLRASIDQAKENPIHKLLQSLSIHHLGKKASKLIAEKVSHVLDLATWTEEDYTNINEIGPVLANNMINFFQVDRNLELLQRLESYGVNLSQTEKDKPLEIKEDAPLSQKTILFTGSLQKMTRTEAQKIAASAGAKNISAVSSNLDILVVGEKAGSKLKKAAELGTVQILTEDEFLELIGELEGL